LKKKQLVLSGIVMERYAPQTPQETSAKKPFQTEQERDTAIRRFRVGDNVKFDVSIYNAKLKDAGAGLVMQYRVYRDAKEIFASPDKPINQTADSKSIDKSEVFNIGKKMPPGDYILQVIVKDPQSKGKNRFTTQWMDFEVVP
jgi:hypothetical protein